MPTDGSPRILIVRPSALGDVARTVPALVSLRRHLPDARIDWLVAAAFADSVRHHPMIDGIVTFRRDRLGRLHTAAGIGEMRTLVRALRQPQYDVVYDLQGLFRSGLFTWWTGARRRVGFANARELAWLGYTHRYRIDPAMHTVDRMLALLESDGVPITHDLTLHVSDADDAWARERVSPPYVCIAPTAAWRCKCWPLEQYTELARRLLGRVPRVVILASPAERGIVQPMIDTLLREFDHERILFPATTVGQLMAVLAHCNALVCNDSAALHLAVGLHRPVVGIFGPTDPGLVGPYPCTDDDPRVVTPPSHPHGDPRGYRNHDDQSLIATVPFDTVWSRVQPLLP